jgi:hypothetical protein
MDPLLAVTCVSLSESICCTIRSVSSFQAMYDIDQTTKTLHGGELSRQLELRKTTASASDAATEPFRLLLANQGNRSEVVTELCHHNVVCCEERQSSLSISNNGDDIVHSLESGVSPSIQGTCPMLPVQKASSLLKRLSSRLNRPLNTVRWSQYTRNQKSRQVTECPPNNTCCKHYDTESQQWNPDSENETSHLLVMSRTDGTKRDCIAPRPRPRRARNRRALTATRLLRLLGSISLSYPTCMVVMSNYAITRGLFTGCNSWYRVVLQVSSSLTKFEKQIDNPQVSTLHIQPKFVSHPSPALMFAACMVWTVLEWAHYFSNENDKYQKFILASAICLGLLPAIGCSANVLAVLLCMVPWAIHLGLVVSDVLHRSGLV